METTRTLPSAVSCWPFDAEVELGAGGSGSDRCAGAVLKDAAQDLVDGGVGLVGHALAAEAQELGRLPLNRNLVGAAGLVAVAGAEHQHPGHGAQEGWFRSAGGWGRLHRRHGVVGEQITPSSLRATMLAAHSRRRPGRCRRRGSSHCCGKRAVEHSGRVLAHAAGSASRGCQPGAGFTLDVRVVGVGEVSGATDRSGRFDPRAPRQI